MAMNNSSQMKANYCQTLKHKSSSFNYVLCKCNCYIIISRKNEFKSLILMLWYLTDIRIYEKKSESLTHIPALETKRLKFFTKLNIMQGFVFLRLTKKQILYFIGDAWLDFTLYETEISGRLASTCLKTF